MLKFQIYFILILCGTAVLPATSITRWFSSSFRDVRVAIHRMSGCSGRAPLKEGNLTEAMYFARTFNSFLDQAQLSNDQLESVKNLTYAICTENITSEASELVPSYPISTGLNVWRFTHVIQNGTGNYSEAARSRCSSVDFVMDELYDLFKRAALNASAPLNFTMREYREPESFYQRINLTETFRHYHLIDLINTLWIKSDVTIDHVCNVTNPITNHVSTLIRTSKPELRSGQQTSVISNLVNFVDRFLDPILGLQRRLYWEGSNVIEVAQDHFSSLRGAVGGFLRSTRKRIASTFRSNSTSLATNSTVRSTNSTVRLTNPRV